MFEETVELVQWKLSRCQCAPEQARQAAKIARSQVMQSRVFLVTFNIKYGMNTIPEAGFAGRPASNRSPFNTKPKVKRRPQLLSSTRHQKLKPPTSLSSRVTRATICTHHNLRKQLSSAIQKGDDSTAEGLRVEIENFGGIRKYQEASIIGQSAQRGGDTSKVLLKWLLDSGEIKLNGEREAKRLRMLDVGALRIDNACSKSELFDVERIDLHSQHPKIKEQDFMQRAVLKPETLDAEGFDIVSLSLVVNFVGDPAERGNMLRHVGGFLRPPNDTALGTLPALFLVLPAPCVINSRYLNEDGLETVMRNLGYRSIRRKISDKLMYSLWKLDKSMDKKPEAFKKSEVRSGKSRNNFAIVLC